jgi:hypothetical protein
MAINTFNGRFLTVEIDFGQGSDFATVAVADPNVGSQSRASATLIGATADHDPEDPIIEGLLVNVVMTPSVGYTIYVHAPNGTWGRYNVDVACTYF